MCPDEIYLDRCYTICYLYATFTKKLFEIFFNRFDIDKELQTNSSISFLEAILLMKTPDFRD
jgi:hypothetical protein